MVSVAGTASNIVDAFILTQDNSVRKMAIVGDDVIGLHGCQADRLHAAPITYTTGRRRDVPASCPAHLHAVQPLPAVVPRFFCAGALVCAPGRTTSTGRGTGRLASSRPAQILPAAGRCAGPGSSASTAASRLSATGRGSAACARAGTSWTGDSCRSSPRLDAAAKVDRSEAAESSRAHADTPGPWPCCTARIRTRRRTGLGVSLASV